MQPRFKIKNSYSRVDVSEIIVSETKEITMDDNRAPKLLCDMRNARANYNVPVASMTQRTNIRLNQQEKEITLYSIWPNIMRNAAEKVRAKIARRMRAVRYIIETYVIQTGDKKKEKNQLETLYEDIDREISRLLDLTSLRNDALVAGQYDTVLGFLVKIYSECESATNDWIQLGQTALAELSHVSVIFHVLNNVMFLNMI